MSPGDSGSGRRGPGGSVPKKATPRKTTARATTARTAEPSPTTGVLAARRIALDALARIEDGAYANIVVPELLARSRLSERDRAFVTELVYGVTRRRRGVDAVVDAHARGAVDAATRAVLRLGAYQIVVLGTAPHAAVSTSVDLAPARSKSFVNAVLRRLTVTAPSGITATTTSGMPAMSDEAAYPDWIVALLRADLGEERAAEAMRAMNDTPVVCQRDDGYIQDLASQWVAEAVGAQRGERVLDIAAAPGGKATLMAQHGAFVVAADVREHRCRLVRSNVMQLHLHDRVSVVLADGMAPPYDSESFDRVLVDAPCSGLGVLHRRPDARWRIEPADVAALASLQRALIESAIGLVRPGGVVVYSVCTVTNAETLDIDRWLVDAHPELQALDRLRSPWRPLGRGSLLLPQDAGTDGMALFRYRKL